MEENLVASIQSNAVCFVAFNIIRKKSNYQIYDVQKLLNDETKNAFLKNQLEAKFKNPRYRTMCEIRRKLPSYNKKNEILELIQNNQVVLISGETGIKIIIYAVYI